MNVILLTVFIGLLLVFFFMFLFASQSGPASWNDADRTSLLPLENNETARDALTSRANDHQG